MKTIEEMMALVGTVGALSGDWQVCVEEGLNPVHIEREINEATRAIEIALRELVERKPLSEDRIETLFKSTELECLSSDDIEDAITFARLIEADHKIGA